MELREIVAPTMKELFIKEIERQIISGECAIGDRLPTEREMERKMKVSRTIINLGLAELARNGFVEIIPRQGAFVGNYIRNGNIDTLLSIMNFNGGKLDKKTYKSLMAYRTHNECECAYLAALNRTSEDLILLNSLHKKINDATDTAVVAQLKVDFHHAIYCASGNTIYPLVFNSFKKLAYTFNEIIFRNYGAQAATSFLPELLKAVELQQADEAKTIMHALITQRIEELSEYYFKE